MSSEKLALRKNQSIVGLALQSGGRNIELYLTEGNQLVRYNLRSISLEKEADFGKLYLRRVI